MSDFPNSPTSRWRRMKHLKRFDLPKISYLFDTGVCYDVDLEAHMPTVFYHSGMMHDSYLVAFRDRLSHTVARYFAGHSSIEFYDTLYRQQECSIPILIHNTFEGA